ncbi:hypothetical protein C8J56DRAFT_905114 [Mycena floridula]|nr:hypothetical protein C8J56DRAFT_905114 [Mycena floridula]
MSSQQTGAFNGAYTPTSGPPNHLYRPEQFSQAMPGVNYMSETYQGHQPGNNTNAPGTPVQHQMIPNIPGHMYAPPMMSPSAPHMLQSMNMPMMNMMNHGFGGMYNENNVPANQKDELTLLREENECLRLQNLQQNSRTLQDKGNTTPQLNVQAAAATEATAKVADADADNSDNKKNLVHSTTWALMGIERSSYMSGNEESQLPEPLGPEQETRKAPDVGPCFQCLRIKNWVYKPAALVSFIYYNILDTSKGSGDVQNASVTSTNGLHKTFDETPMLDQLSASSGFCRWLMQGLYSLKWPYPDGSRLWNPIWTEISTHTPNRLFLEAVTAAVLNSESNQLSKKEVTKMARTYFSHLRKNYLARFDEQRQSIQEAHKENTRRNARAKDKTDLRRCQVAAFGVLKGFENIVGLNEILLTDEASQEVSTEGDATEAEWNALAGPNKSFEIRTKESRSVKYNRILFALDALAVEEANKKKEEMKGRKKNRHGQPHYRRRWAKETNNIDMLLLPTPEHFTIFNVDIDDTELTADGLKILAEMGDSDYKADDEVEVSTNPITSQ